MKNILLVLAITLFFSPTVIGQNFFFFDGNSYPCSETFTLQANSEDGNDLNVSIAKDGATGLFTVSTISNTRVIFSGKLIIYLDDGTVITCIDRGTADHVDDRAKAVYYLTSEELNKMKKSNINTVRYTLKCAPCHGFYSTEKGDWSASNKSNKGVGYNFPVLITEFFDGNWSASNKGTPTKTVITERQQKAAKKKKLDALLGGIGNTDGNADGGEGNDNQAGDKGKTTGDPNASGYYRNSGSGENYILLDRKPLSMPKPTYDCNEEGKVYVSISVDQSGKVISAEAGITGTTNSAPCLLSRAKEAALKTRFNFDSNAPAKQSGAIIYDFKDDNSKLIGDPNASGYYGNGGSGSGENYRLGNRKALTMPKPTYDCNEEGKVIVSISVDKSGNVIAVQAGIKGTTNSAACLLQRAKEAALKTKFNSDTEAPAKQVGTIIYNFSLSK